MITLKILLIFFIPIIIFFELLRRLANKDAKQGNFHNDPNRKHKKQSLKEIVSSAGI